MAAGRHSPQTFAGGQGPGSGRECWRRATVWAAASLKSLSAAAAAAERPLFASHHLSARGKQTQRDTSCSLAATVAAAAPGAGGRGVGGEGGGGWGGRPG